MERQKKTDSGITLVALVVSIIVMLVLAGVSLNATIGENGIVTNAQKAAFANRISGYKEELEINIVREIGSDGIDNRDKVTLFGLRVKDYIPSLKDEDVDLFGIIAGEIYYIGEDELEAEVAKSLGIKVKDENISLEDYVANVEALAIENIVKNFGGEAFENNENNVYGVPLYNKNLENANRWKLITEVSNNSVVATYGTGWYYVESGTNVDGIGILSKNYIINYNTRKAVQFDANKHTMMSYESSIAVSDHLIFNADPGIMEEFNNLSATDKQNFDLSKLGDNLTMHGYYTDTNGNGIQDENEKTDLTKAFTKTSFIFDGENDYINIPYDNNTKMNEGFTLEFYGKISRYGLGYDFDGNYATNMNATGYLGIFDVSDISSKTINNTLRFGFDGCGDGSDEARQPWGPRLLFDFHGLSSKEYSATSWSQTVDRFPWFTKDNSYNQCPDYKFYYDDDIYYILSYDNSTKIAKLFANGILVEQSDFSEAGFDIWIDKCQNKLANYEFGRSLQSRGDRNIWIDEFGNEYDEEIENYVQQINYHGYLQHCKMECYSLRFYNKGLTDTEMLASYNATVSYHKFLANNGNGSTGGEIGGEDLGEVNTIP